MQAHTAWNKWAHLVLCLSVKPSACTRTAWSWSCMQLRLFWKRSLLIFLSKTLLKSSNHWHPVVAEDNYKCLFSESLVCYMRKPNIRWTLAFQLYRGETSQPKHSIAGILQMGEGRYMRASTESISLFPVQRGSKSSCTHLYNLGVAPDGKSSSDFRKLHETRPEVSCPGQFGAG